MLSYHLAAYQSTSITQIAVLKNASIEVKSSRRWWW